MILRKRNKKKEKRKAKETERGGTSLATANGIAHYQMPDVHATITHAQLSVGWGRSTAPGGTRGSQWAILGLAHWYGWRCRVRRGRGQRRAADRGGYSTWRNGRGAWGVWLHRRHAHGAAHRDRWRCGRVVQTSWRFLDVHRARARRGGRRGCGGRRDWFWNPVLGVVDDLCRSWGTRGSSCRHGCHRACGGASLWRAGRGNFDSKRIVALWVLGRKGARVCYVSLNINMQKRRDKIKMDRNFFRQFNSIFCKLKSRYVATPTWVLRRGVSTDGWGDVPVMAALLGLDSGLVLTDKVRRRGGGAGALSAARIAVGVADAGLLATTPDSDIRLIPLCRRGGCWQNEIEYNL